MKYIILLLIPVLVFLGFNNKNLLSKYSHPNLATVSNSDDYTEPDRGLSKLKVNISKSTTTLSTSTSKIKSSYSNLRSVWTHFIDNKKYTNLDQVYPYGTNVVYYFTDWTDMNKYGFFKGWLNDYTGNILNGSEKWPEYKFTILRNTETVSKYQNCAKPFPENVYFNSVNALERKIFKFAKNTPDKNIKIKAGGEISAVAVVYGDGGVCAVFTEGCTDGVSCSLKDDLAFISSYKDKNIVKIIDYHTHDYNTYDAMFSKNDSYYVDNNGRSLVVVSPAPSVTDLKTDYNVKISYSKIMPNVDYDDKVISSTGAGYLYSVPKGSKIADKLNNNFDKFEKNIFDLMVKAQDNSMNKSKRVEPNYDDAWAGINAAIKEYRSLGAVLKEFSVN